MRQAQPPGVPTGAECNRRHHRAGNPWDSPRSPPRSPPDFVVGCDGIVVVEDAGQGLGLREVNQQLEALVWRQGQQGGVAGQGSREEASRLTPDPSWGAGRGSKHGALIQHMGQWCLQQACC